MTEDEEIYYANYALIDVCDDCGEYTPITNYHDGKNHLTLTGKWLKCPKCMAEPSERNDVS